MKTDRRSRKTISAIQNTALQLMCSRRMNEIKIVDLCMAADINRTTFYLHYRNIDEVMQSLLDDIASKISETEAKSDDQPGEVPDFLAACTEILDSYEYFGEFIQKSPDAECFLACLKNVLSAKILEYISRKYGGGEKEKIVVLFVTSGLLDVYARWLKSDKTSDLRSVLNVCAPMVSAGRELLQKLADRDKNEF